MVTTVTTDEEKAEVLNNIFASVFMGNLSPCLSWVNGLQDGDQRGKSTSPASSSGAFSTRRAWSCWSGYRGGPQRWSEGWSTSAERVGAVQPGEEKAAGRPYSSLPVPERGPYRKDGENIFSRACCDRTRSNGFKLREGRLRLDISKKLCTMRVVKHWHRLPRGVVYAPSLEAGQGWATWSSWRCPCSLLGGWTRWPLKVPSKPNYSMIVRLNSNRITFWNYSKCEEKTNHTVEVRKLKHRWIKNTRNMGTK